MRAFDGKVVIVTGGGSGLREALGKRLAADGASVVLTDINREAALGRIGTGEALDALRGREAVEEDAWVREELKLALAGAP